MGVAMIATKILTTWLIVKLKKFLIKILFNIFLTRMFNQIKDTNYNLRKFKSSPYEQ